MEAIDSKQAGRSLVAVVVLDHVELLLLRAGVAAAEQVGRFARALVELDCLAGLLVGQLIRKRSGMAQVLLHREQLVVYFVPAAEE